MKAITVVPGDPSSVATTEVPDPEPDDRTLLVEGELLGICGTDADIVEDGYGSPPPGEERLLLGHESLGVVREAPRGSGFSPGDRVAGIVRRPDPVPCGPCGEGQWDFCLNGRYTERGIKELHGYGSQLWRLEPEFAIPVDPSLGDCGVLVEPASVLAKAWEQTERILGRAGLRPRTALITGAGPIGLFGALMGVQRGLDVHVLDRNDTGPKPDLVRRLGATYHTGEVTELPLRPDVVIECTGHGPLVFGLSEILPPAAVLCLTGIASGSKEVSVDTDEVNKTLVLDNSVVFGTVNAARRHYEQAARALAEADRTWLERLITRRVPMDGYAEALHKGPQDVKVVVDLRS
ncbi:glucose 1-dehydrogenase [Streptomyces sp. XM4193]|uniref:glucose 1-dehydrogenase n=1 Tax=Streptomyces sp. XM4193 TaxID=2929782 RepID=UPI001FF8466E|nr:glucose 1-dehydrogenase [Streptomyces sp. XM4193]MCK1795196.1 glucose 1-dehydrogenase [Streptomyces sp. XM4193]